MIPATRPPRSGIDRDPGRRPTIEWWDCIAGSVLLSLAVPSGRHALRTTARRSPSVTATPGCPRGFRHTSARSRQFAHATNGGCRYYWPGQRRSFERRFKEATNNSVLEYVHRIRVEGAKRQFECSRKNISEVMYDVGYTDTKAFRDLFKKLTGLTPIEYRNKYNKMAMA